ncbi:MAG: hypothetical protein WC875_02915 [Candidatus Absconditabacterales bacterium]|jgi:hypothetical protein
MRNIRIFIKTLATYIANRCYKRLIYKEKSSIEELFRKLEDESVESIMVKRFSIDDDKKNKIKIDAFFLDTMESRIRHKEEISYDLIPHDTMRYWTIHNDAYLKKYVVNTKISLSVLEFHKKVFSPGSESNDPFNYYINEYQWIE